MERQRDRILALLDDGRVVRRAELAREGYSQGTIARMLDDGTLARAGTRGVRLSDYQDDPLPAIAARFGGDPGRPRGILCLHSAARLHGYTDLGRDMAPETVLLRYGANNTDGGLPLRVVRWRVEAAFDEANGLEWREWDGHGIHVTSPERTVVDLFARRVLPTEGGHLVALDRMAAERGADGLAEAGRIALALGIHHRIKAALEAAGEKLACATLRR